MIPDSTLHIVNGRVLSDKQYANYKEEEGRKQGYQAGSANIREAITRLDDARTDAEFRAGVRDIIRGG